MQLINKLLWDNTIVLFAVFIILFELFIVIQLTYQARVGRISLLSSHFHIVNNILFVSVTVK